MSRAPGGLRVGLLAYEDYFASELFLFSDLLQIANQVALHAGSTSRELFTTKIITVGGAPVVAAGGFTTEGQKQMKGMDLLVVPGFELIPTQDFGKRMNGLQKETKLIGSIAARGIPVASICVGAFLLGEARLLDGRRATTSWLFADRLQSRHPLASVQAKSLIEEDTGITTTAAFSAAQDLALRLIRRHAGTEVGRITGRLTLVSENRSSQAPFVVQSLIESERGSFSGTVCKWLGDHLAEPYDLSRLASAFHVSSRTMLRRFRAETGQSPLTYLQELRIASAKHLLESTDHKLQDVMRLVGYLDPTTFRHLFASHVGMSPTSYRRQFRSTGLLAPGS